MPDRFSDLLHPEYRVERELGGGGMSRVFLAEEPALGRRVVVKVLPPELTAVVSEERFRREIQLAGSLQHPNIVPLYTAGAREGLLFLTMPFVEGESLRARLAREGELPLRDAVRIARDVLDALSYAHARGIVHRDIKPENILLSGRHALVTDFGVAKALAHATASDAGLTSTGLAIGTPAYMAPEQAAADPHIDHRADLYAVGLLLYEMLTGRRLFGDLPPAAVLAAHATRAVTGPAELRPAVPPGLDALVMRCLEKRPADRPQSADELLRELDALENSPSGETAPTPVAAFPSRSLLRRVAVLGGLAAVVATGLWVGTRGPRTARSATTLPPDSVRVIIVADFQHGAGDTDLARGVSAALRSRLQDIPGLFVPNTDMMQNLVTRFLGINDPTTFTSDSLFEFVSRTGGHGMLAGSVERLGTGFVISVQLRPTVRQSGPATILSLTESAGDSTQLVPALHRLTEALRERLSALLPSLHGPERLSPVTARSLEALRLYVEALRGPWQAQDYGPALEKLRQAVRLDSTFAEANRRLATGMSNLGIRRAERIRAVEAAWRERERVRPWERRLVEATYHKIRGDWQASVEAYQKAVSQDPNADIPLNNLAVQYTQTGQHDLAERLYRRVADTTLQTVRLYENNWLHSLLNLGRLREVDSLLAQTSKVGSDTGNHYADVRRSRLVVERRYSDLNRLTGPDAVTGPNSTSRLLQLEAGQYAALVLGLVRRFEDLASQRSAVYQEFGDGRGGLMQGLRVATARLRVLGDAAGARIILEEAFRAQPFDALDPLDRPYPELASLLADLGSTAESERLIRRWEQEVPAEYHGLDRDDIERARGDATLARNQPDRAIEHYRRGSTRASCAPCNLPRLARAWDRMARPDSAIAIYERYLTLPGTGRAATDAFELARAYLRLGELYESAGSATRAIERYGNLLELWENADPVLQPLVRDVRARIDRLQRTIG
jgi:serine/threonine protein kinase/tetratricopeptide (TPR) repeat protein